MNDGRSRTPCLLCPLTTQTQRVSQFHRHQKFQSQFQFHFNFKKLEKNREREINFDFMFLDFNFDLIWGKWRIIYLMLWSL
jgi:hypothetical protein